VLTDVRAGTKVSITSSATEVKLMSASLGCYLDGAVLPRPADGERALALGITKRTAHAPLHPADKRLIAELRRFVKRWLRLNLDALGADYDLGFQSWLAMTPYPQARKDELSKVYSELGYRGLLTELEAEITSFVKDESYPDYKYPRPINARDDFCKVMFGPIFRAIESVLFKLSWFIKKVPTRDQANVIFDTLYRDGSVYTATDYSSFESLFSPRLMKACEIQLYDYMMTGFENKKWLMKFVTRTLTGRMKISSKGLRAEVIGSRMSGEMCTSLGNSFTNLMIFLFLCEKNGLTATGFVEGDDGLFRVDGGSLTSEQFQQLGLEIKLQIHDHLGEASFCGRVFDEDAKHVLTDPKELLASFSWCKKHYVNSNRKTRMALLKAKAMSYYYQYPNCPIVSSFAWHMMRLTKSFDVRKFADDSHYESVYKREILSEALKSAEVRRNPEPVNAGSRLVVEKLYGISVSIQIKYEDYFGTLTEEDITKPIPNWFSVPSSWSHCYDNFLTYNVGLRDMEEPVEPTELPFQISVGGVLKTRL